MNLNIKKKLLLIVLIPLIGVLYYSVSAIYEKVEEKSELEVIKKYLIYSVKVSRYIHELQKERGLSSGYIGSHTIDFKIKMKEQRKLVDNEFNKLKKDLLKGDIQQKLNFILEDEEKLKNIRKKIDLHEISFQEYITYFNSTVKKLINPISKIILLSKNYNLSKLFSSYTALISAKEYMGINRAILTYSFNSRTTTIENFSMYNLYKALYKKNIETFQEYSGKDLKKDLKNILNSDVMSDIEGMQLYLEYEMIKNKIMIKINAFAGYGGLIHDFKNYLLRGEDKTYQKFILNYKKLNILINEYLMLESTPQEVELLNIIKSTFTQYKNNLDKLSNDKSIKIKDKLVKVDDTLAINALNKLSSSLVNVKADKWYEIATKLINKLSHLENKVVKNVLEEIDKNINKIIISLSLLIFTTITLLIISILLSYIYIKNILTRLKLIEGALVDFLNYVKNKKNKFTLIKMTENDELTLIANVLNNSMKQTDSHITTEISKNREKDQLLLYKSQEQEIYLNTVIESNNSAIIAIDTNGKITTYNKKAEEMFMWTKEEMLNTKNLLEIIPPEYKKAHEIACRKFFSSGDSCGIINNVHELEGLRKNGEIFPIKISFGGTYIPQKSIVVASIIDLTKEKEQEALGERLELEVLKRTRELEIASRAKSEFLANMSHEIRTPLNGIIGFIDILYKNESNQQKREKLGIIKESGYSLLTIINDILDFSKLNKNKLLIEKIPIRTKNIFVHVISLFFDKANERNISIAFNIDEKLPEKILGDSTRIKQVFSNLLSNAIKFSNPDSEVEVNVKFIKEKNEICCAIIDTGKGIKMDNLNSIFKSFEQEDGSITRMYGGTGLGLSISKSLIELMNGRLDVESEIGKGSKFSFYLPVYDASNYEITGSDNTAKKLKGKILIAEDNKTNQILLSVLLDDLGLDYEIVNDGLEAVEAVKRSEFNLILMDENMPNMSGIEATKIIKKLETRNKIPILAVTANAIKGDREKFLEAGMDDYISKPINANKLKTMIKKYI